jgi:hypothetical protein
MDKTQYVLTVSPNSLTGSSYTNTGHLMIKGYNLDLMIPALMKDYFYKHFMEWVELK